MNPAAEDKRPPVRTWRWLEQELWIEMLAQFSDILMTDTLARSHREENRIPDEQCRAQLRADLAQAAELADGVLEEVQYRGWIQKTAAPKPKRRAKSGGRR